jgi:protein-ribulosamine 3-kinase
MRSLLNLELKRHGPDDLFEKLKEKFFNVVIPRYLRPLETDGRSIQPCLIHSDLWPGNIKPKADTGDLCMFDSCAYWGHNEGMLSKLSIKHDLIFDLG